MTNHIQALAQMDVWFDMNDRGPHDALARSLVQGTKAWTPQQWATTPPAHMLHAVSTVLQRLSVNRQVASEHVVQSSVRAAYILARDTSTPEHAAHFAQLLGLGKMSDHHLVVDTLTRWSSQDPNALAQHVRALFHKQISEPHIWSELARRGDAQSINVLWRMPPLAHTRPPGATLPQVLASAVSSIQWSNPSALSVLCALLPEGSLCHAEGEEMKLARSLRVSAGTAPDHARVVMSAWIAATKPPMAFVECLVQDMAQYQAAGLLNWIDTLGLDEAALNHVRSTAISHAPPQTMVELVSTASAPDQTAALKVVFQDIGAHNAATIAGLDHLAQSVSEGELLEALRSMFPPDRAPHLFAALGRAALTVGLPSVAPPTLRKKM